MMKRTLFILIFLSAAWLLSGQSHIHTVGLEKSEVIFEDNWVRTRVDVDADSSRTSYKNYCVVDPWFSYPIFRTINVLFSVLTLPDDIIIDSVFIDLYCQSATANTGIGIECNPWLKFSIADVDDYYYVPPITTSTSTGWNTYKIPGNIAENNKFPTYMSFSIVTNAADKSCGVENQVYYYLFHATNKPILTIYYTAFTAEPKKIKIIGVI